ncbi:MULTISPECIES: acylneuraminate cytidylyltransferase [Streptomyces]|uniref:N-acylneuraminate cytidylyltransferase n=1 Tax=Streptomyces luteosporeus TaxID=173856 RepID=A0ABN3TJH8_9ACTN
MAVVLAVIPARGGSKGVPAKNLAPVGGVPLVARAVRECRAAQLVTDVVVSTDDPAIAAAAEAAGAEIVHRPAELSGDTASSEGAVLHAMETYEGAHGCRVDVVLLVQCTSPFLTATDIDGVAAAVLDAGADTALTVAPFHGFVWRTGEPGAVRSGGLVCAHPFLPQLPLGGPPAERLPTNRQVPPPARPAFEDRGSGGGAPGRRGEGGTGAQPAAGAPAPGTGVNHDPAHRPRRQDRTPEFLETGAAYAMRAHPFRTTRHRFFGRTDLVVTDPSRVLEIDDPHDLERARALAPLLETQARPAPGAVDAVVLDFDGTQTDDRVLIDADGRELVAVHRGDGLGVAALRRAGLAVLVLSSETNPVVAARARKLGVPVIHGSERKDVALKQWCAEQGVDPDRVLYAGNDVNDLPCMALAGWPVAVADAHPVVRAAARAVTAARGGRGAVREIAAWLLGPSLQQQSSLPQP